MRLLILFLALPLYAQKPNIVLIISDDAGYADWGFMDDYLRSLNPDQSPTPVPTPNLDSLRARGTLFTNAYTAAVCSPSRAAIVTGSYQQRVGYEYNINNLTSATAIDGLSPETTTIFDRLGDQDYTTGVIGKWHLGARANDTGLGNRPENQGVDEFFGIWKGSRNYTIGGVSGSGTLRKTTSSPFSDIVLENTPPWNTVSNYVTNAFGIGAVDFIERHHADEKPFFLYVAFTAPHGPIGPSPDIEDPRLAGLTGTRKNYASMVLTMDKEVGKIIGKLDDPVGDGSTSLLDDTLVIFINDNGGASGIGAINTPLSNFKGSVFEGGTRVPMLIAGPGLPTNHTFHAPVHTIDILPTCLEASGALAPSEIDGVSLLPYLKSPELGEPHQVLTIRNGTKIGVRMGDWKLTKNSSGAPFTLFNLADDIGESANLASSHPDIVANLLRQFTDFEVSADKPQHAGLGNSPASINLNDRFVLNPNPAPSGSFTSNLSLVGGSTLNGNFNAGGPGGVQTFAQTPAWENLGTGSSGENFTNTSLASDGSRNAIISKSGGRSAALDPAHTLTTTELFQATYKWRDASGWNDSSDRLRISLFTTSDNTLTGSRTIIQSFDSQTSSVNSSYQSESALFNPIPASADGLRLFLLVDAAQSGSGFARLDDLTLDRGSLGDGGNPNSSVDLAWSDFNAWTDPVTSSPDTFLRADSFPGCILDFPATSQFSYRATNDLTRITDLTFILNSLRMTGTFTGTSPQSATIGGNDLLFTRNLDHISPTLALDALGPDFSYHLNSNLILYHDLHIVGDGTASFTINGTIGEYHDSVGLTKSGSSSILVSTSPSFTGPTIIAGGQLTLAENTTLSSPITLSENGILSGDGTIVAPIKGPGRLSPGKAIGTLTTSSEVAPGNLFIEIDGTQSDHLHSTGLLDLAETILALETQNLNQDTYPFVTWTLLPDGFQEVRNLPENYLLDYQHKGHQIALVRASLAYEIWARENHSLFGADALPHADPDNDHLPNVLEFLTGSDPKQANSSNPLQVTSDGSFLNISYPVSSLAKQTSVQLQFSQDLLTWQDSPPSDGIPVVGEIENFYRPGLNKVSITYPMLPSRTHFVRLISAP